jgi:hypothetical protein
MRWKVTYQYATYHGQEIVDAEDSEQAIARAWARLRRRGYLTLSMAYTSAKAEQIGEEEE